MAVRVSPATPRMRHPVTASVPPSSTTCTFAPISPSPAAPRHPSLRCSCGPVRCPCAASCTGTFPWVPLTMRVRGLASRGRTGLWELLEFGTCIDGMAGRRLPSPSRRGTARAAAGGWPAGAVGQRPGVAGAAPPAAGDARAPRVAQRRVFWCVDFSARVLTRAMVPWSDVEVMYVRVRPVRCTLLREKCWFARRSLTTLTRHDRTTWHGCSVRRRSTGHRPRAATTGGLPRAPAPAHAPPHRPEGRRLSRRHPR